jgi:hypothetical protein
MSKAGQIHSVPIEKYKIAYNLLQAFTADFHFNEEQPIEKAKLIHFIYQLSQHLEETKCAKMLKDNNVTQEELDAYFRQLTDETLI